MGMNLTQLIGFGAFQASWQSFNAAVDAAATLNPSDKSARITLSGGDLSATSDGTSNHALVRATHGVSCGRVYFEVSFAGMGTGAGNNPIDIFGLQDASLATTSNLGSGGTGFGWGYGTSNALAFTTGFSGSIATAPANAAHGVALDADAGLIWFRNAGGWLSGDPSLGTSPTATLTGSRVPLFPALSMYAGSPGTATFNFGASAFTYAIPTG